MPLSLIQCWTLFLCTKNYGYKGIQGSSCNKPITCSLIFQMAKLILDTNPALVTNRVSYVCLGHTLSFTHTQTQQAHTQGKTLPSMWKSVLFLPSYWPETFSWLLTKNFSRLPLRRKMLIIYLALSF